MEENKMTKKCMVVSIVGLPNAGKSTLLNKFVGTKVSIVSSKVQTTRSQIRGILTEENTQLIFIDTPGIFTAGNKLGKSMVRAAFGSLDGVDAVIYMIDGAKANDEDNLLIQKRLAQLDIPLFLVINKIDLLKAQNHLLYDCLKAIDINRFKEVIEISAKTGKNLDKLKEALFKDANVGEFLYDEEELTDQASAFMASEITREKLYLRLAQELPYDATVETEKFSVNHKNEIVIHQSIYVKKPSQKKIVIGDNAQKIKTISMLAKKDMETLFERKVHLFLHARVKENWQDISSFYEYMGLSKS